MISSVFFSGDFVCKENWPSNDTCSGIHLVERKGIFSPEFALFYYSCTLRAPQ